MIRRLLRAIRESFTGIDIRLAVISFILSLVVWYWVDNNRRTSSIRCVYPVLATSEAVRAYDECLEGRRRPQNLTNSEIGIKPKGAREEDRDEH